MPTDIFFTGNRKIQFVYDATGAKLQKIVNNNGTVTIQHYVNGVEYNGNILERLPHTEGEIVKDATGNYIYQYALKDHLGNRRVTFVGNTTTLGTVAASDIKQVNHYYPFGMNMEGPAYSFSGVNKYQYNEKELNTDFGLNWNDYGARFYDASIGRFLEIDPLATNFRYQNPYTYAADNPVKYIDFMGMGPADGDPNYDPSKDPSVHNENTYTVRASAASAASSAMANSEMYNSLAKFWERSGNFAHGVRNAFVSNLALGFPGTRADPNEEYEDEQDAEDFADGQTAGDIITTFVGTGEMLLGGGITTGSVVLEIPSFGTSTVGVAAGGAMAVHGTGVTSISLGNLLLKAKGNNNTGKKAKDSSASEQHGDNGRAWEKAQPRIKELQEQLKQTTGTDAKKLKQKIKNIIEDAYRKDKGVNDSNTGKRK